MTQSQSHGYTIEQQIVENIFNNEFVNNDTKPHDIEKNDNKYDNRENISIKCSVSDTIYCGDCRRIINYDFGENNTIMMVFLKQVGDNKIIKEIIEIDYNKKLYDLFLGQAKKCEIEEYILEVKKIATNVKGLEAKKQFDYIKEKKKIKTGLLNINPKVDSSQTRVQCSFNIKNIPKEFIKKRYLSKNKEFIRCRDGIIKTNYNSPKRTRNGITVLKLKQLCRENKLRGYSNKKKDELIKFLKEHNISILNNN